MTIERTCVACRKKSNKTDFIKVILNKNGNAYIDENKNLDGRGAYICKSAECINKCAKTRALNRSFKTAISQSLYEELIQKFGS